MFFPMPPLAEQVRIVSEIEKFEPLIAEYDKLEQQATKLDGEIYDKLKKAILQYVIITVIITFIDVTVDIFLAEFGFLFGADAL